MRVKFLYLFVFLAFLACSSEPKNAKEYEENLPKLQSKLNSCFQNAANMLKESSSCKLAFSVLKTLRKQKYEYYLKREREAKDFVSKCKSVKNTDLDSYLSCYSAKEALKTIFAKYVAQNYKSFKNDALLSMKASLKCEEKLESKLGKEPLKKEKKAAWLKEKEKYIKAMEPKKRANCENAYKALYEFLSKSLKRTKRPGILENFYVNHPMEAKKDANICKHKYEKRLNLELNEKEFFKNYSKIDELFSKKCLFLLELAKKQEWFKHAKKELKN